MNDDRLTDLMNQSRLLLWVADHHSSNHLLAEAKKIIKVEQTEYKKLLSEQPYRLPAPQKDTMEKDKQFEKSESVKNQDDTPKLTRPSVRDVKESSLEDNSNELTSKGTEIVNESSGLIGEEVEQRIMEIPKMLDSMRIPDIPRRRKRTVLDVYQQQVNQLQQETKDIEKQMNDIQEKLGEGNGQPFITDRSDILSLLFMNSDPYKYEVRGVLRDFEKRWKRPRKSTKIVTRFGSATVESEENYHEAKFLVKLEKLNGHLMVSSLGIFEGWLYGDADREELSESAFFCLTDIANQLFE